MMDIRIALESYAKLNRKIGAIDQYLKLVTMPVDKADRMMDDLGGTSAEAESLCNFIISEWESQPNRGDIIVELRERLARLGIVD